jgi:hypothetical protein
VLNVTIPISISKKKKKTSGTVESPRERMLNGFAHEFLLHFYIIAISGPSKAGSMPINHPN